MNTSLQNKHRLSAYLMDSLTGHGWDEGLKARVLYGNAAQHNGLDFLRHLSFRFQLVVAYFPVYDWRLIIYDN
jgi:hypothetical protein